MPFSCRCEQCGRGFESEDPHAWICPICDGLFKAAIKQTNTMPPPNLDERPWSKSWSRDRLGVNANTDE